MLESRPTPSSALLHHHDRVLGWLFAAGFSASLATHAFSTIDAFVYGFVLSESTIPFEPGHGAEAAFAQATSPDPAEYPNLARSLSELFTAGDYAYSREFEAGLRLILDAVEARRSEAIPRQH